MHVHSFGANTDQSDPTALKNPDPEAAQTNQIPAHGHSLGAKLPSSIKGSGRRSLAILERTATREGWSLDLSGVSLDWPFLPPLPKDSRQKPSKTKAYQDTRQRQHKTQDGTRLTTAQDSRRHKTHESTRLKTKTQDKSFQDSKQKLSRLKTKAEITGISHTHSSSTIIRLLSYDACLHVIACACSFKREEQVPWV